MSINIVIYSADDVPLFVLVGGEEIFTHDIPEMMPAGGTWRVVEDVRVASAAPAVADVTKPDGAPR
jgi:hypothetical protein